ncbi:hypothetical protein BKA82DRAFT_994275 [Pisolithus tinctorius]|uniref:Zn(2)-C6 fungal-type domain-containing protein n=1 Tax=Pisolithus tinctorius Marx 270 TaxID=870435 RepID=A0A0C3PCM0_PISTI|nr:hypothetical protein BKA82DRAFT_994275 [Pisolithus tinctorius]KIO11525.1 hypothetical protein M404DRAFT_994275 [Pisolithus tinctorius Marx 270]
MSDRQDRSPSCSVIPVPFVLGMQHDTHPTDSHGLVSSNTTTPSHWLSTAFQSAPTYTPSLSSNFVVDEFPQPHAAQFVDMLETGMRITYPSPTGPPPHPPTPFLPPYPNNTVLSPTCHHSPVSPSPLSHLHQPALAISNSPPDTGIPRRAVAGSLDPSTGIFYRTPEPPRLRTAQACEKCRVRKAKCSGEHPACQRCLLRGLACIYASEGRTRGPTKLKVKPLTMVSPPESRSTRRNKNRSSSNGTSSSSSPVSSPNRSLASPPDLETTSKQTLRRRTGSCSDIDILHGLPPLGVVDGDGAAKIRRSLVIDTGTRLPDEGISPSSLVLDTSKMNGTNTNEGSNGSRDRFPPATPTPISPTTSPIFTPTNSTASPVTPGFHLSTDLVTSGSQPATFAPPNSSSCLSSTPLLYDDCFTQDNGDLEFLSSLGASPTLHRRGASTQATDTTTGSAMDISGVLGEYLDWTSLKDIKEHWEGDLSDMETLFNVT